MKGPQSPHPSLFSFISHPFPLSNHSCGGFGAGEGLDFGCKFLVILVFGGLSVL
jgi:hypothetical protein